MTRQQLVTYLTLKGLPPEVSDWNYSMFGWRFHRVFLQGSFDIIYDSRTKKIYDSEQVLIEDNRVTIPQDYLIELGNRFFIFINGRRHRVYQQSKGNVVILDGRQRELKVNPTTFKEAHVHN